VNAAAVWFIVLMTVLGFIIGALIAAIVIERMQ
jgi:hypothetical protein